MHLVERAAAALCLTIAAAAQTSHELPNFLFLVADDLGIDRIGCYGGDSSGEHPDPGSGPAHGPHDLHDLENQPP